MSPKRSPADDKTAFFASLALFDRPEKELRQRVLEHDDDVDGFVEAALQNVTIPPQ